MLFRKDLPFYFSGGFFSGGFRVRDADWRHLTCDTAIERSNFPSEGEVASASRNCGEAHSSWTGGGMEFEGFFLTRNLGALFGMPSSVIEVSSNVSELDSLAARRGFKKTSVLSSIQIPNFQDPTVYTHTYLYFTNQYVSISVLSRLTYIIYKMHVSKVVSAHLRKTPLDLYQ